MHCYSGQDAQLGWLRSTFIVVLMHCYSGSECTVSVQDALLIVQNALLVIQNAVLQWSKCTMVQVHYDIGLGALVQWSMCTVSVGLVHC